MHNSQADLKGWVFVIGTLVIISLMAVGMVWGVQAAMHKAVQPVESIAGDMGTRVSDFFNPTPTILPNPITVIRDIRSLSRLETIQYTVEKVITAESGQEVFGNLFGDKLLFVARGLVVAGVDLGKLAPDDLTVEDNVLYVKLPDAEVFIATLDNEKSYVYDRQTGLLTKGNLSLETLARQAAEKEIEKAALEDGILDLARQNAENFLYRLLRDLGYAEVIFKAGQLTPTPPIP